MSVIAHRPGRQQRHDLPYKCSSTSTFRKHAVCSRWSATPSKQGRRLNVNTEAMAQRAVVLLPGLGNNSKDYKAVGEALESRGLHVQVASRLACR